MPDLLERLSSALGDRYAIEREVGRGGMAVVFLAEDVKHHRQVALKVLHPELTATLGAERFLQEIEIVAGLQHPHILPLYDSGEADGLLYYVMPYAEGESLRQRLDREKQLAVDESVRITVEVADGLDYAHRKGVVHRDIKPGNILLAEGHATIADFGIARAIEAARAERVTSTGLGVGTPLYASPEQATAQETLDGRTDIYSLGCVLYEMLAGQPPLTGATPQMIQARRVSETPSPLHDLRDTVPPALDHVIARALARIPADRYATASQFAQALQAVLFAATPAAHADLSMTPGAIATTPMAVGLKPAAKSRRWLAIAIPVLVVALIAVLWPASDWFGGGPVGITTSNIMQVTNAPGLEFQPALSPDGGDVAYIVGPRRDARMEVRSANEAGSSGVTQPVSEMGSLQWLPAWTSDGMSVRFRSCVWGNWWRCDWKEVGKFGGSLRSIDVPRKPSNPNLSRLYAWSPDESRVAFAIGDSIFAASVPDGEPVLLGVHTEGYWSLHSFAWSPNGRWIAYVNGNPQWVFSANVSDASVWVLDADGGEPIQITDEESLNVSPQWLPDSRHLLFVSDRDGPRGVYVVEVVPEGAKGSSSRVPGPSDPHSISISTDGRRLAYSKLNVAQNIWSIPIPESGSVSLHEAVPVTHGNRVIEDHDLSPDGGWLVFDSSIRGGFDIFRRRLNGGSAEVVAEVAAHAFSPVWSPDGTEIAFYAATQRNSDVFVVEADGGTPQQLTNHKIAEFPAWSPDGLTIAFHSRGPDGSGLYRIWTVSRNSVGQPWGAPVQLIDYPCSLPDWAPDGSGFVCDAFVDDVNVIALVSSSGEVLRRFDPIGEGLGFYTPTYSPDGSRIYFIGTNEDGIGVYWTPAGGGDFTKVVAVDDPTKNLFNVFRSAPLTVGPDNLYLTISDYDSDIWVMDLEW